ncbi:MAG TPA: hypothetical protein QF753_07295 [Victivallales bacterium]|nr:hypothetical protein [Victivallales bacterium]
MKIGDKVHVISMGTHRFVSTVTDESSNFWKVRTARGYTKYSKKTLKKMNTSTKGYYIEPLPIK